jgi:hypothetical protein
MCTIEITSVTASGSGTPTAITVSGTADLCTRVEVKINCSGGVAAQTVLVGGGTWTAVFDASTGLPAQCACQANIRVTARCVDDPTGANICSDDFSGVVECEAVCPNVLVSASVAPECNTDGTRTVTLISVHSPGPAAPTAQWDLGAPFVLTPNVIHSETHHYAPGAHTATLSITGCPPVSVAFDVPICPCPDLQVSASPDADHCTDGLMDVALTVSTSFTATLSCTWAFGDGTTASFTLVGPGTDTRHHDYAPGPHTATLTVVDCPTQTAAFSVPPCPPPGGGDDGDGDGGGSLCGLLCAIWAVLLAAYLVGIATGALANPVALGLATAVLVAFTGLYVAVCGVCSYAKCTLAGLGLFLLVVILMLIFSLPLPGLVAAGIAAAGFLVAALLILALAC